jgi:hypothetical protein
MMLNWKYFERFGLSIHQADILRYLKDKKLRKKLREIVPIKLKKN